MPQLMPLMWVFSSFMSFVLILVLMNLYFFEFNKFSLSKGDNEFNFFKMSILW